MAIVPATPSIKHGEDLAHPVRGVEALTINEAAGISGWSARMLRYIESVGLVEPPRSSAGYRLYGPAELQRLRTLRELLSKHDLEIGDVAFAGRLRTDPKLGHAVNGWLDRPALRPPEVPSAQWLVWEQEKHKRLIGEPTVLADPPTRASTTQLIDEFPQST